MPIPLRKIPVLSALIALLVVGAAVAQPLPGPAAAATKAKKQRAAKKKQRAIQKRRAAKRKVKAKKKVKAKVNIVNAGQNPMVNRGVLKVKVRSHRKGKIKVRGYSATYDGKGVFKPLTRAKWPRFRRAGQWRTIKLKLTNAGRKQAARCEDRDLKVFAGPATSRLRAMVRQTADCRPGPVDLSRAATCDFIAAQDPAICMSPFPDDFYTLADTRTATGRRIDFKPEAMPKNQSGTPIDPANFEGVDGFSQGQTISVRVPGLDNPAALAQTNPVGLVNPARYAAPNAPVIVMNARTRERHPIWVEIDSKAGSPATTNLLIHPMVNFDPATRYVVILRYLKDANGTVLNAPAGFRYYRDFLPSNNSRINGRRSHFEDIFKRLRNAGIKRSSLYLAWDFTTASDENNSERALAMRDQAFGALGDANLADRTIQGDAPGFTVDSVQTDPSPQIARRIAGTFTVPCFLDRPGMGNECESGATLNLDGDGVPRPNGTYDAVFECVVPRVVTDPDSIPPEDLPTAGRRRALVYGHGLMGSISGEIHSASQRQTAARGFVICGTDEIGMAMEDFVTVAGALGDLSTFPRVADRLQQGLLNEMLLARLMIHPRGLVSKAAFRYDPEAADPSEVPGGDGDAEVPDDTTLEAAIQTGPNTRAWYRGISQGGIMGGALMALAPDFDRGALGVAAMNYSVLLTRSAAWDIYSTFFDPAYANEVERPLALGLTQMLWDRAEPNGYAHRVTTNPLPATPPHQVLIDAAFGDHLVTNWQTNAMARTVGARTVEPLLSSTRWPGVDFAWGLEPIPVYPYSGSALAYWDGGPLRQGGTLGTNPPPLTNTAPLEGEDPHELPRVTDTAIEMIDRFLRNGGAVTNPCAPGPCLSGGWTGS